MADWRASDWLTASEIAALRLAGMPATKRGVLKHAEHHGWRATTRVRRRTGKGGGWEYHVSLLPDAALDDLLSRRLAEAGLGAIEMPPADAPEHARALARARLVLAADAMAPALAQGRTGGIARFCRLYNAGKLEVDERLRALVPQVSPASLRRWRAWLQQGRMERLANTARRRPGRSPIDRAEGGRLAEFVAGLLIARPQLSAAQIRHLARAEFGEMVDVDGRQQPLPSVRAFQRWLAGFKRRNAAALARATNPDLYKSKYRHAGGSRDAWVRAVNDLWEIDASPADVMTKDGRVSVYVCIDAHSRRMLAHVSKTPRTDAMLALVKKAILAWGVPRVIRSDNGSDFTSYQARATLKALGIEHDVCPPFSPDRKGKVERAIRTLMHGCVSLLPGFVGHNVAERKVIEARKAFAARLGEAPEKLLQVDLTMDELQAYIDRWVEHVYQHQPHQGLGGRTPFAVAAADTTPRRTITDEAALAMLAAPLASGGGLRTVGREGVRVNGHGYITRKVPAGTQVLVRLDPADMGRVWLFHPDTQELLDEAICPELSGIDPAQAHAAARKLTDEMVREQVTAARREAKRIARDPRGLIERVTGDAERRTASLAAFPPAQEPHETDAIAAIEQVGAPPAGQVRQDIYERESARLLAEWRAEREGNVIPMPQAQPERDLPDDIARFRRALELQRRREQGERLNEEEARWLAAYEASAEYRASLLLAEDYPELYGLERSGSGSASA